MKERLRQKAVEWAERKGFKTIKAQLEDYEAPKGFSNSGSDEPIAPDVTGFLRGRKSYIDIAVKEEDPQILVSRWKLFGTLAARKGGKLYLLAARGHKAFAERIVKDYGLTHTTVVSI